MSANSLCLLSVNMIKTVIKKNAIWGGKGLFRFISPSPCQLLREAKLGTKNRVETWRASEAETLGDAACLIAPNDSLTFLFYLGPHA